MSQETSGYIPCYAFGQLLHLGRGKLWQCLTKPAEKSAKYEKRSILRKVTTALGALWVLSPVEYEWQGENLHNGIIFLHNWRQSFKGKIDKQGSCRRWQTLFFWSFHLALQLVVGWHLLPVNKSHHIHIWAHCTTHQVSAKREILHPFFRGSLKFQQLGIKKIVPSPTAAHNMLQELCGSHGQSFSKTLSEDYYYYFSVQRNLLNTTRLSQRERERVTFFKYCS